MHASSGQASPGRRAWRANPRPSTQPVMPFKANAGRRHHIPRQRHKAKNWAGHDAGLGARGSLTGWFAAEAVEGWRAEARRDRGGQPEDIEPGDCDRPDIARGVPPRAASDRGADRAHQCRLGRGAEAHPGSRICGRYGVAKIARMSADATHHGLSRSNRSAWPVGSTKCVTRSDGAGCAAERIGGRPDISLPSPARQRSV